MAETAVARGLMPHQKDEHDIWICKECGWKYPNAKPSAKIRKNHKKHCPGKAGADAHAAGGSSDEASDDDHHVHHKASAAPQESAVDAPVPPTEVKSREFDFASLKEDLKAEAAPAEAPTVNGAAEEAPAHTEASIPAAVPINTGGLLPHQKDEHDIWICKECGWKYPNAKPSPKIRKNHKKHCPGKGSSVAKGGSSDDASDDEHHHAPAAQTVPVESGQEESPPTAPSPAEAPTSVSREIDFAALKESPAPEVTEATPTTDISPEAGNGTKEFSPAVPEAAESAVPQEAAGSAFPQEALVSESEAPEVGAVSGLMLHQKDEHDVWVCKDCGWKYPNAKPSPKIRKHHKKKCTGKRPGAAGTTGGSSDDASDDEHHHNSLAPAAPVEVLPAVESGKEDPAAVPEVPESISRDIDFAALKESSNSVAENQPPAVNTDETTPPVSATETATKEAGSTSLKEAISKETEKEKEALTEPVSLREAINKESEKEKDSATATSGSGGLMLHQKDESDVWVCKECGWKYPNAKPSAKIRNNHKKKCPGHGSNGASLDEVTHDEALDHEDHSTPAGTATDKDVKDAIPAVSEAEVPGTKIKSREFSLRDALQTSDVVPAVPEEKATEKEDPGKVVATEQAPPTTIGGLMPHQKDDADVWVCKDCGWTYPNAKPSAKIRKNHKKKCPKQGGAAKVTNGASSGGTSSDDENKIKGGKCFRCF